MKARIYRLAKQVSDGGIRALGGLRGSWTAADGPALLPAVPAQPVPLPRNADQLPADFRALFGHGIALAERRVHRLHRAVVSWHGVVFQHLRLFLPSVWATPRLPPEFDGTFLLRQWLGRRHDVATAEVVGLAHGPWAAGNYYHWLVDTLPRLHLLQRTHPGCPLLVPEPIPAYVRQTAAMFGFERLVPLPAGAVARVPELAMPDYPAPSGFQDGSLSLASRNRVMEALGIAGFAGQRRVYVSRSRQRLRRLLNETAIEPLLTQYGFETLYFEELSFAEQVRLMTETTVLVGVHGANLTNMLFMRPGATVVELMNRSTHAEVFNPCYYYLANALQLSYYCLPCQGTSGEDHWQANNSDLEVEYAALQRVFANIFPSDF
ncbi:glycosyltransferase family 61 protein [Hymenobacter sp. 5317J-9]|uniref:glycosyltransferase family 61 protein n=1 Tax=Hymenobacter sp. 5317J-9 TaxID=2932250 RepID=UPI001FD63DE5|nr:glycosyltransferase family 61 protein [Hymenobacter sp. 5317J-9]UOQ97071.1 glycosyltransferase family 61 protein [Hymenobacter sp. 5317J-9]